MIRLQSSVTEKYELEVIECECGFHIGLDATYLDQVSDIIISCPSCGMKIDTAIICLDDEFLVSDIE